MIRNLNFKFPISQAFPITLFAFLLCLCPSILSQAPDTLFFEDWESGQGIWFADNGVWEWGTPTNGPGSAYSGQFLMGSNLAANYPPNANTRLISPSITLPGIQSGEEIRLFFWHWFRINETGSWGPDNGFIEISVSNGPWQTIAGSVSGLSPLWNRMGVDLSSYADSTVRIAFYLVSNGHAEDNGWYIDDISIQKGIFSFANPEDFETGIGDWYSDNGLWQIGVPSVGPSTTHSGQMCAGADLGGNYQPNANTRLISPKITLTAQPNQNPLLCFWQWFRINETGSWGPDNGYLQISVNNGPWETIGNSFSGLSPNWTQFCVDLSAYIDSTIQLGFYLVSNGHAEDNGWYIDDVSINGIITGIDGADPEIPVKFLLSQNYPNPFNPSTTIRFSLPRAAQVRLTVFNVLGQQVTELLNERKPAGEHTVTFDGRNLSSGVYYYRIEAEEFREVKKMVLVR